ncbi:MAG: glycosyltransferase family 2 protein [Hyphomicrobium sp.]
MNVSTVLHLCVASWQSAGFAAPALMARYVRLTLANRTSKDLVIRNVPARLAARAVTSLTSGRAEGDAVIPVYNNFDDTEALLQDLADDHSFSGRVIIVHDASTDPRLAPMLARYAAAHRHVTLIENERNLGFVASCNRGMAQSDRDVVILNTDIGLPAGVLNRILCRLHSSAAIATVTPLSNSAYGTGFPLLVYENAAPFGAPPELVDRCFAALAPVENIELATGIGFCMGISRAALTRLGAFDPHFGQGYGEETDFCQRASTAGLRNVLASDCFVMHKGGQSFGASWQDKARKGLLRVLTRHTDYPARVARYLETGETRALGFAALVALAEAMAGKPAVVIENTKTAGGGVSQTGGVPVINLSTDAAVCVASVCYGGEAHDYRFASRDLLNQSLARVTSRKN